LVDAENQVRLSVAVEVRDGETRLRAYPSESLARPEGAIAIAQHDGDLAVYPDRAYQVENPVAIYVGCREANRRNDTDRVIGAVPIEVPISGPLGKLAVSQAEEDGGAAALTGYGKVR
jgi:hypothetical protein